jgi:protein-S-isoprenylcysteine O-methyltransferase Ste14
VVFRALIWMISVVRVPYPALDSWLIPIRPLWQPAVLLMGVALLILGFAAVVLVHTAMGQEWRSGIQTGGPQRLMTHGAFAVSRNPTFIGIQVAQLGLFLALPSLFTLVCLIVGMTAIHIQVRLEEAHLAARFGAAYDAYRARVPRWLFPLARRPGAADLRLGDAERPPAG